jgi:hypothetical protein
MVWSGISMVLNRGRVSQIGYRCLTGSDRGPRAYFLVSAAPEAGARIPLRRDAHGIGDPVEHGERPAARRFDVAFHRVQVRVDIAPARGYRLFAAAL